MERERARAEGRGGCAEPGCHFSLVHQESALGRGWQGTEGSRGERHVGVAPSTQKPDEVQKVQSRAHLSGGPRTARRPVCWEQRQEEGWVEMSSEGAGGQPRQVPAGHCERTGTSLKGPQACQWFLTSPYYASGPVSTASHTSSAMSKLVSHDMYFFYPTLQMRKMQLVRPVHCKRVVISPSTRLQTLAMSLVNATTESITCNFQKSPAGTPPPPAGTARARFVPSPPRRLVSLALPRWQEAGDWTSICKKDGRMSKTL